MNKTPEESAALAEAIKAEISGKNFPCEVVLCPTFLALDRVAKILVGTGIGLGAQDMHWEDDGAYTGKVSASQLKSLGVTHVILGHSEQRSYFHETDETVAKKTLKALAAGLTPIVCVGESLQEREAGQTTTVVNRQIEGAYGALTAEQASQTVVAYEPVWAIGTGKVATPAQAQETHAAIRAWFRKKFGDSLADGLRIQYGGSMKAENAEELLRQTDIDGGLIGGAALKADSFLGIISASLQTAA
jgi:triosephosphate isomerase